METKGKNIGKAIAEIREEKGLSHDDVAERAIVTAQDMARIESGTLPVDEKTLQSIARVLVVTTEEIINHSNRPHLTIASKSA